MKSNYCVHGYAPSMFDKSGHSDRYHKSIHEALTSIGVDYNVAIPQESRIENNYCKKL